MYFYAPAASAFGRQGACAVARSSLSHPGSELRQRFLAGAAGGEGLALLTVVDISPPVATAVVRYEQVDLDCFRFKDADGSFDLALAVEVIEHIQNLGLFLAELARLR